MEQSMYPKSKGWTGSNKSKNSE
uniref:Uncharacterized protein n=1 Tax=Arundo donax TaxID=35708 RepID=A0A0A9BLF6_ARUDO